MKVWKGALSLLLALTLTAGLLAGCSGQPGAPNGGQYQTEDIIAQLTDGAVTRDAVMVTVDGQPITAEALLYWAAYDCDYLVAYHYGTIDNMKWDDTFAEDQDLTAYILSDALSTAKLYRLLQTRAAEDGVTLTEEDQAALQAECVDEVIAQHGSEEAFKSWLSQLGLSYDAYYQLNSIQYLYHNYLNTISDEDMDQYISENQIYRVKHILIRTQDAEGNTMSDADKAAAKTRAEELLQQLRSSDDPLTLFDQLMNEYSEDPGLAAYPDGYTTAPGEMNQPFETASLALAENEISDLVESVNGYHIILRLDADTEETRGSYFDATLDSWMNEAVVEETDLYKTFDLKSFYTALTNYRNSLQEAQEPEGTGTPAPTVTPSETPTS